MKRIYIIDGAVGAIGVAAWFLEPTGWLACACAAFLLSITLMFSATRNILAVSYRKKLYDMPGGRRVHKTPIPRLGGLAFAPIVCCSVILAMSLHHLIAPPNDVSSSCLIWLCSLIFIHMTGVIDDMIGVHSILKLSVQIIAGALVVSSGFWIDSLHGLLGIHSLPSAVGMPVTVVFIVYVINAINLIDGIDGLAAGLSAIALAVYGALGFVTGLYLFSIIAFATLGTIVPFLYANVRGLGSRRHKLFMGDTGSQTLGLVISILAIGLITGAGIELPERQNFVLVLSPLLAPLFDVVHVVVVRLKKRSSPFRPDMSHIHHRLFQKGFNPRQALLLILALAVVYTAVNMMLAPHMNMTLIFAFDVALWCLFNSKILQLKTDPRKPKLSKLL